MLDISLKTANVYGIYGNLGGGKTLTSVEIAINVFLRAGHKVVSNVELFNLSPSQSKLYTFVEDFSVCDWWALPCGAPRGSSGRERVAIIIDECAEFFDQWSGNNPLVKNALSWLRHSSKRGQFVFCIVQKPEFVNKSLRLLINKWIVCDDLEQLRLPVLHCRLPFCSNFVNRRIFDRWGNLISPYFNLGSKSEIGRFYNTAQSIATKGRSADYAKSQQIESRVSLFPVLVVFVWVYALLFQN